MNPIIREFFRGLRERDELDVIIPELLTAMGFEVLSRPMIGPRQFGADVAAIGTDDDGIRKLFLFAIKRGDLTRQDWDGASDQALRPSLNEIKDAYLQTVTPSRKELPVIIVPTIGGAVLENVRQQLDGYISGAETDRIKFRVWTGDTLTTKIVDGALREEVFPANLRNLLRKAAALVEEPERSLGHFSSLIDQVLGDRKTEEVAKVRILYLALWILTVWGRDVGNLEAPYRASEKVVMRAWDLLKDRISSDASRKQEPSHAMFEVVSLHWRIWDDLIGKKILPHAASDHALSFAVRSKSSLDVNLALFEMLGRAALGGLWRLWSELPANSSFRFIKQPSAELEEIAKGVAAMIAANPALSTPVTEDQGIDISLALLLMLAVPATQAAAINWVRHSASAIRLSLKVGRWYPIISRDYSELLRNRDEGDLAEKTSASIIQPLFALVALAAKDARHLAQLHETQTSVLSHSNYQTWVPNARTDDKIWKGERWQGSALGSLVIGEDGSALLDAMRKEAEANDDYRNLSAIVLDHWPMLLLACRAVRLPPPPQLWLELVDELRAMPAQFGTERVSLGGRGRVKMWAALSTAWPALMKDRPTRPNTFLAPLP